MKKTFPIALLSCSRWVAAALLSAALLPSLAAGMGDDPRHWINRMHVAVDTMNYQGTLVRMSLGSADAGPQTETFLIYHRAVDGDIAERLVGMDGEGYEVIRNLSETICIFPAEHRLVVEKRVDGSKSPLTAGLPAYSDGMEGQYQFAIAGSGRVAGRDAKVLQIAAIDHYRYSYRIWLDKKTAMPLKSQLRSADGQKLLEEVIFANITLQTEVPPELVMSAYDTRDYTKLMPEPGRAMETGAADIQCVVSDLPPGFTLSAARHETMNGVNEPRLHLVYTDGLASVSVFVDTPAPGQSEGEDAMGSTHAYTVMQGMNMVTAVGQVPAETVQFIATSMHCQP